MTTRDFIHLVALELFYVSLSGFIILFILERLKGGFVLLHIRLGWIGLLVAFSLIFMMVLHNKD